MLAKRTWSELPADPVGNPAQLAWVDFQQWCCMLRAVGPSAREVRGAAAWAMDHADAAEEVAAVLADSVCTPAEATPVSCRIARLYVISDILLNGVAAETPEARAVATRVRSCLLPDLPRVFECLGEAVACVPHRMRRGAALERVERVVAAWRKGAAMLPSVLAGLEAAVAAPHCIHVLAASDGDEMPDASTPPSRSEAAAFGAWLEEGTPAGLARTRNRIHHARSCDKQRRAGTFRLDAPLPVLPLRASDCVAVAARLRRLEQVQARRLLEARAVRATKAGASLGAAAPGCDSAASSAPEATKAVSRSVPEAMWESVA